MKILVVQLARLGDIYQTWPTLLALSRQPGNEVHVMIRSRFLGAVRGLPESIKIIELPTKAILSCVYNEQDELALEGLQNFCTHLVEENYDRVINLSFSPFSSWLTCKIQPNPEKVRGYTRHGDGYFYPVDDSSAYFYAQVGPERHARLHLTHVFAAIAQVEITENDIHYGRQLVGKRKLENPYWTVQLCASTEKKTLTSAQWTYVLRLLTERFQRMVVLLGSEQEYEFAENIRMTTGYHNILNLCGQTRPDELFDWIGYAELHLCPDSMTTHIASLVNTPTLNISLDCVNFWETGPIAKGSRVLPCTQRADIHAKDVVTLAQAMLGEGSSEIGYAYADDGYECYKPANLNKDTPFDWQLTLALYMSGDLPRTNDPLIQKGLEKTLSVLELGLQQIETLKKQVDHTVALEILQQVDTLLKELEGVVPALGPFFRWFHTERVRIPPEERMLTLLKTQSVFAQAHMVATRLLEESSSQEPDLCS